MFPTAIITVVNGLILRRIFAARTARIDLVTIGNALRCKKIVSYLQSKLFELDTLLQVRRGRSRAAMRGASGWQRSRWWLSASFTRRSTCRRSLRRATSRCSTWTSCRSCRSWTKTCSRKSAGSRPLPVDREGTPTNMSSLILWILRTRHRHWSILNFRIAVHERAGVLSENPVLQAGGNRVLCIDRLLGREGTSSSSSTWTVGKSNLQFSEEQSAL